MSDKHCRLCGADPRNQMIKKTGTVSVKGTASGIVPVDELNSLAYDAASGWTSVNKISFDAEQKAWTGEWIYWEDKYDCKAERLKAA